MAATKQKNIIDKNVFELTQEDVPVESHKSSSASSSSARPHLSFLDGLRGLAALFVVLHHAYETSGNSPYGNVHNNLPVGLAQSLQWLLCGHLAVVVFIALSGYLLMMPIAKHYKPGHCELRGGFISYIQRRARRILPPYFAALFITLLLLCVVPGLNQKQGVYWDQSLPAFDAGAMLSHFFMVHNLTPWSGRINYPLWTVATEWQIYFLLPLLLLPLLRRFGLLIMVSVAVLAGILPHYLLDGRFDAASPQFVGVFAVGAAGALITFSPHYSHILSALPWRVMAIMSCTAVLFAMCFKPSVLMERSHLVDVVVGGIITIVLIHLARLSTARHEKDGLHRDPVVLRSLQSAPVVTLGSFSYSLYLVHAPILAAIHLGVRSLGLEPVPALVVLLLLGTLASLVVSFLFHLAFEKPFMTKPTKKDPSNCLQYSR